MTPLSSELRSRWGGAASISLLLSLLLLLPWQLQSLNADGGFLLSFKYAVLSDPLSVLADWNYDDATPCAWNGVMCAGVPVSNPASNNTTTTSRVVSLVLPNAQLLGSIPPELAFVEHLRHLDLSGNFLNGTLPSSLFNASELRILTLSDNEISGEVPELVGGMKSLQTLNLSDNALTGTVPSKLSLLPNLTVLSLGNNYLSGPLSGGGFELLQVLDLSSNLVNGSLPAVLGGSSLRYLNLSYNRLTGEIPAGFGSGVPANATMDLSFNNLTGKIPETQLFLSQKPRSFAGNPDLCGTPLKDLCPIPSTLSNPPPNVSGAAPSGSTSPPAFAAIPRNPGGDSRGAATSGGQQEPGGGLRPVVIAAITVGDLGGIAILFVVFLYVYHVKKRKQHQQQQQEEEKTTNGAKSPPGRPPKAEWLAPSTETRGLGVFSWCSRKKAGNGESDETSNSSSSSEMETEEEGEKEAGPGGKSNAQQGAVLVMVDGELELELETLLKASAYILGATASSIVYKAVLADGTALAVRRIGESSGIDKLKDFEAQVRSVARFRHPNLLRIRGFYWGADEKLLIYDYASNGSLGNITFSKKQGSSPYNLNWDARLCIARGVARCLAYLHEKKCVHGNIKPSNILLGTDFEPLVGDLGLERLLYGGDTSNNPGTSSRQFGSKRSTHSQSSSLPDLSPMTGASLSPSPSASCGALSAPLPYHAPESLKNLKPSPKWDVYSFGVVLLELIAGRVFSEAELCQWNAGFVVEESSRVLRMADPTLRGEVEGKEEALLTCFKLGFSCASLVPQRRPSMKDVLQVLDRIPFSLTITADLS